VIKLAFINAPARKQINLFLLLEKNKDDSESYNVLGYLLHLSDFPLISALLK
jgi:hypothetical protein